MHNASASDGAETNATACASDKSSDVDWNPDVEMSDGWESTYVKETHVSLAGVEGGRTTFFSKYVENAKGNVDQFKLLIRFGPGEIYNGDRPPLSIVDDTNSISPGGLYLNSGTGGIDGRPLKTGNYTVWVIGRDEGGTAPYWRVAKTSDYVVVKRWSFEVVENTELALYADHNIASDTTGTECPVGTRVITTEGECKQAYERVKDVYKLIDSSTSRDKKWWGSAHRPEMPSGCVSYRGGSSNNIGFGSHKSGFYFNTYVFGVVFRDILLLPAA
jgi:hypothetical protein